MSLTEQLGIWSLKSGPRFGGREKKKQFGGPQNGSIFEGIATFGAVEFDSKSWSFCSELLINEIWSNYSDRKHDPEKPKR